MGFPAARMPHRLRDSYSSKRRLQGILRGIVRPTSRVAVGIPGLKVVPRLPHVASAGGGITRKADCCLTLGDSPLAIFFEKIILAVLTGFIPCV